MSFRLKIALAFMLATLPALAQTTGVEGTVKDKDGKPVVGAVVDFDRTDIKGHYTVKTDKKGHYGYYGLPLGTFSVSVSIGGQKADQQNGVRTHSGDPLVVDFNLKPAGEQSVDDATRGMTKAQKEEFEKKMKEREGQMAKNKALNDAYNAGKAALDAKQWDAAVENFVKASEIDASQGAVWTSLADAYVGQAGAKPTEAAAIYDKAFAAFQKAIEITPNEAGLYNNYALALAKDKKLEEAKTNLNKAAELDAPGAGRYFYNMGALLVNGGQNDAAEEQFKKAIAADPNYADAQYQYGVTLAAKASTDASGKITPVPGTLEAFNKYLELKPDGPYAAAAKEMIATLGGTVSTTFSNPNAPKKSDTKAAPAPAAPKKKQ